MAMILPFRRRRSRWSRASTYGGSDGPRFWPDRKKRITARGVWRSFLFWLRPVGLAVVLVITWIATDPRLVEPPRFLTGEPEPVDRYFSQCRKNWSSACVVDGDTIALGKRRVRIVGIDTAEMDAKCPTEAAQAQASTEALQKLLNEGPFVMTGRVGDQQDGYGRDLRTLTRTRPDGTVQNIAEVMRETGGARRYLGGLRGGWC
jgi:micrococcal nuclease